MIGLAGSPQKPADLLALQSELEQQIPAWLTAASVPGLSIAIINDAKVVWRRGFGIKDRASNTPVRLDTMFEAASMSKPVFAYVVLKLCDKGVLDLDTPLVKYTPERFLDGDPRLDLITARHVLSHTGGFQNWRSDADPLRIHFTPGAQHMYSGEGYNYLQTVVTRLLGEPFEAYMQKNLFRPFGMTSSGYVWSDAFTARMAQPHDETGRPISNNKSTTNDVARYGSAGALLTTPSDYAKFMTEVIAPRPRDAFRLGPDRTAEMLRKQVGTNDEFSSSWALGWRIISSSGRDFFMHAGVNKGFHSVALASLDGRSGYVAMTNGDNGNAVLNNLLFSPLMQRFLTGPEPAAGPPASSPSSGYEPAR